MHRNLCATATWRRLRRTLPLVSAMRIFDLGLVFFYQNIRLPSRLVSFGSIAVKCRCLDTGLHKQKSAISLSIYSNQCFVEWLDSALPLCKFAFQANNSGTAEQLKIVRDPFDLYHFVFFILQVPLWNVFTLLIWTLASMHKFGKLNNSCIYFWLLTPTTCTQRNRMCRVQTAQRSADIDKYLQKLLFSFIKIDRIFDTILKNGAEFDSSELFFDRQKFLQFQPLISLQKISVHSRLIIVNCSSMQMSIKRKLLIARIGESKIDKLQQWH